MIMILLIIITIYHIHKTLSTRTLKQILKNI